MNHLTLFLPIASIATNGSTFHYTTKCNHKQNSCPTPPSAFPKFQRKHVQNERPTLESALCMIFFFFFSFFFGSVMYVKCVQGMVLEP